MIARLLIQQGEGAQRLDQPLGVVALFGSQFVDLLEETLLGLERGLRERGTADSRGRDDQKPARARDHSRQA